MASIDREVRRLLGKACHAYRLIEDGDRIAVAVSGGKDSLLLLWLLRERLRRVPIRYELTALHVDPGFDSESADRLEVFFLKEGFSYEIVRTDYGLRAHSDENRENPCFLCARLRRMALFKRALELDCRKIAFGHNKDDFIETFFINLCYSSRVAGIVPKQVFFGGEITAIRPLALIPSSKVQRLVGHIGLPVVPNSCPSAGRNKRQEMRDLLEVLYSRNSKVRGNIFHAMSHVNLEYLPPPIESTNGCATLLQALQAAESDHKDHGRKEKLVLD